MRAIGALTIQLSRDDFTRWTFEKESVLREVAVELGTLRSLIPGAKITLLDGDTHRTLGTFVIENGTLEPYAAPTFQYVCSLRSPPEFSRGT